MIRDVAACSTFTARPHSAEKGMSANGAALSPVDAARQLVLGPELYAKVTKAKLLVVGAGGIGCELLKDLVLTGFEDIEILDLDHIDVSNLNRQFLFRARHVGQPKAVVAREMALHMNPRCRIVAHHDNIKAPKYDMAYFAQFDVVLNALDNVDARRHVNRMCLATDRPMIDAGTTGYTGQVNVMRKGQAACYECEEKATQKVYPICTIRSTPDKPVHCVVWAKEAFKLLFAQPDSSMLYEAPDSPEPSTFMPSVNDRPTLGQRESVLAYGWSVLSALFVTEIAMKVDKGVYAKAQTPPKPLTELLSMDRAAIEGRVLGGEEEGSSGRRKGPWAHKVLSVEECVEDVLGCLMACYCDMGGRAQHVGALEFDKDDAVAMRFVSACTNLRQRVFSIAPLQPLHECKGIAGNIIPAIATTNAMAAGLQVLEALKLLDSGLDKSLEAAQCKTTYISRGLAGRKKLLLQPTSLLAPSPKCFVCNKAGADLVIDTTKATFGMLMNDIIMTRLVVSLPQLMKGDAEIVYDGENPQGAASRMDKTLAQLGMVDQTRLELDDLDGDMTMELRIRHRDQSLIEEEHNGAPYHLTTQAAHTAQDNTAQETEQPQPDNRGVKRRLEGEAEGPMDADVVPMDVGSRATSNGNGSEANKRAKVLDLTHGDSDLIILDD